MGGATLRGGPGPPYYDVLVHDTGTHSQGALSQPGYLEHVIDPAFGTKIVRVTGDSGTEIPGFAGYNWGDSYMPVYAKMPVWSTPDGNGDSLLMIEYTRATGTDGTTWAPIFLDGNTYEPLYMLGGNAAAAHDVNRGNRRWHPTLPDILVEVDNDSGTIHFWNVRTNSIVEVYQPSLGAGDETVTFGSGEGNLSLDGRWVVMTVGAEGSDATFFIVDMTACMPTPSTNSAVKIGSDHTISEMLGGGATMDWVTVSPLGTYIVVSRDSSQTRVFEWNQATGAISTPHISEFTSGHFDLIVGHDGMEYALDGLGRYVDLRTGVRTTIWNNGSGWYHVGTHPGNGVTGVRGWGIASTYHSSGTAANELIAYSPKGSFYRLCHHRMTNNTGTSEYGGRVSGSPCAIPSPDGKRVFFGSDWGNYQEFAWGNACQGYVLDIRNICP